MYQRLLKLIIISSHLLACAPITVTVGKSTSNLSEERSLNTSQESSELKPQSWNSIEDLLSHLDSIKAIGTEALLKHYHKDGRREIRQVFRRFREAIVLQAGRSNDLENQSWQKLKAGNCMPIQTQDLFGLGIYGDLRPLLETVFLAKIKPENISTGNSQNLPEVDDVTKLGFFELGISMDGSSKITSTLNSELMESNMQWLVTHEQNEPTSWQDTDRFGVQFHFAKTRSTDTQSHFIMEARRGELSDLISPNIALPALAVTYDSYMDKEGQSHQRLLLQTGYSKNLGSWTELAISRKFDILQDIARGHILHIVETEGYTKSKESMRSFRIDFKQQELCGEILDEGQKNQVQVSSEH
ncbi:MAG: hypothetical protein NTX25_19210 [Proteobacteria bacterium]|nr:hypothetical protein [Pseudomonadota bacterium]